MGLKVLRNPDVSEEELHVSQWEPYTLAQASLANDSRHPLQGGVAASSSLRALLDWLDRHHLSALHSSTQIIIVPGYEYKIVKMLVTNFHQPKSTLLLLVSAFVGGNWRTIYDYALAHDFRFLSYGDSSLLIP
jgi:S-adenosylmethionine:tRNA ribosyltransferase-isomerase